MQTPAMPQIDYRPITKFWRVGKGIAEKLAMYGIDTMGKVARQSVKNEELLYRLFGVNAELETALEKLAGEASI